MAQFPNTTSTREELSVSSTNQSDTETTDDIVKGFRKKSSRLQPTAGSQKLLIEFEQSTVIGLCASHVCEVSKSQVPLVMAMEIGR